MYIVKLNNKKIYDQRIDDLTLIEPVVELEENSAGSFTFTMANDHPYFDEIKRRSSIIQVLEDDELLFSGMVYEVEEDFFKNKKVYCEGELSYLNDSIQRPAEYKNMTVRGLLEAYVNNHNAQVEKEKQFKVGMVTVKDSNDSIFCYTNMETTMQCLKDDLVDDLGGIIRVRHSNGEKYIDYINETDTRTNNQVIRLGENLINYKSNISSLDIATAIIPLGAKLENSPIEALDMRLDIKSVNNGRDYVADSVSVNTFGWIYKTVTWDNVTKAQNLKEKGLKYLNDTQFDNLVIEVNALDMHLIDSYETPFRLSDQIRIVSKPHGLKDKYFRLTRQSINLNNPEQNTITLGKEEHLSLSARTVQTNEAVYKAMESIVSPSSILKQAKDNATALINGNGENGYVVLHENDKGVVYEILIMDKPTLKEATKIWRWNQNGFGYANSKDAKGNFKFGTAITMDGSIVADYITSGVMSGDLIKGGSLVIGGKEYLDSQKQQKNPAYNGSISIKDMYDTVLATINNQGIAMKGGSINLGNNFIVDTNGSATFKKGSINLGAITDSKGNVTGYNYSVNDSGTVTMKQGSINLGLYTKPDRTTDYNFKVETDGKATFKQAKLIDDTGTLSLSGGNLHMSNTTDSGGAGVYADGPNNLYACWGAKNSAARADGKYLEVPTYDILNIAQLSDYKNSLKQLAEKADALLALV